jgi:hypothetical protein
MVLQVAHAINQYRSLSLKTSVLLLLLLAPPLSEARAYNQDTHQLLVDYTWQIMLAVDIVGRNAAPPDQPFLQLSVSPGFSRRVQEAVRKIHLLPANLPAPKYRSRDDPEARHQYAQLGLGRSMTSHLCRWNRGFWRPRHSGIGAGQVLGRLAG